MTQHTTVQAQLDPSEILMWVGQPIASRNARMGVWGLFFGILFGAFGFLFFIFGLTVSRKLSSFDSLSYSNAEQPFTIQNIPEMITYHFTHISSPLDFLPLMGILASLFGIWLMFAPRRAYLSAKHTYYAITDRRVLILFGRPSGGFMASSFNRDRIEFIEKIEERDGRGHLLFATELYQTYETVHSTVHSHPSHMGHSHDPHHSHIDSHMHHSTHIHSRIPATRVQKIGFIAIPNVNEAEKALRKFIQQIP